MTVCHIWDRSGGEYPGFDERLAREVQELSEIRILCPEVQDFYCISPEARHGLDLKASTFCPQTTSWDKEVYLMCSRTVEAAQVKARLRLVSKPAPKRIEEVRGRKRKHTNVSRVVGSGDFTSANQCCTKGTCALQRGRGCSVSGANLRLGGKLANTAAQNHAGANRANLTVQRSTAREPQTSKAELSRLS